jgi:hypothetical protein
MNINSLSIGGYTGQLSTNGAGQTRLAPPPPPPGPPPGEGGFINAIGSALESLGVTDVAAKDKESAASSLGSFLQELMTSLHDQGEANGAGVEGSGARGGPGGPGRLAEDLQSLISSLQSDSETGQSSSLESSFSSLLSALGTDSSDSSSKLVSFLQTLADKLPQAGSSGNLVNTTA